MIIGITGSMATGTSTAAEYIANLLKAELIDADKVGHAALKKSSASYKAALKAFGKYILKIDNTIDRSKLGEIAFLSKKNIKKLSDILHPVIIKDIKLQVEKIYKKKKNAFIVIDGPVLVESKFHKKCDLLIVVSSSLGLQIERATERSSLKPQEILIRIRHQMPLHKKVAYADYVIDNSGSLKELKEKCNQVVRKIKKEKKR